MPAKILGTAFALTITLILMPLSALSADKDSTLSSVLSQLEKQVITDYYKGRYGPRDSDSDEEQEAPKAKKQKKHKSGKKKKGLPPGLAKREKLPPGLAKQLERNGRLPPGLEKRELPDSLENMLPETREGLERVLVDNDVVLIEKATGVIMDILKDVF